MHAMVFSMQGYTFNPHALPMALAALGLLFLGLSTLWRDRHSTPSQMFFWFILALADYFACFALAYLSQDGSTALFWVRLAYLGVPLVPVLLFSFVGSLQDRQPGMRALLVLGWGLGGLFVLAALTTDWLIAGVDQRWWGFYKRYGVLGAPFLAYALAYGVLCDNFYRRLLRTTSQGSRARLRLKLHMRALVVGCLIAVDFLPGFGWPLYPFGYMPALAVVVMLLTAMRRYGPVFFTPVLASALVLETMGEALFMVDEDGVVRKANHAAENLLGRPRQALLGQPLAKLLPAEPFQKDLLGLFAPGASQSLETSFDDQEGHTRYLNISGSCLANSLGEPLATLCIVRDVTQERQAQLALRRAHDQLENKVQERTQDLLASNQALAAENQERRRTETLLRQSEEKYRLLVDNAQEAIFICQEGLIRFCNAHTQEIFGHGPEQLIGRPFLDLLHPQDRPLWPPAPEDAAPQKPASASRVRTWRAVTKTGRAIAVQAQAVAITWEGRPARLYFLHDVTARQEMEAQLAHASKLQALGTLASGIAHDFNNLLQAISGYAHLLRQGLPPRSEPRRYLEEIEQAVERGSQLVRSLLSHGRQLPASSQAVDINQTVERAAELLGRTIPKMIDIRLDLAPALPLILGDQAQLEQVLLNLGANARDAMPGGGLIAIATSQVTLPDGAAPEGQDLPPGPYVLISFADSGQGMDQAILARAFEPFFTTKEVGQGSGLGLFLAYGVVRRHGGQISCHSRPGRGASFHIHLPVPPQGPALAQPLPLPPPPPRGSEAILLVDDETQVLEPASEALSLAGYRVHLAHSGEAALEIVRKAQPLPDLVVLDLGMPGMGGLEGLRQLKMAAPQLKVIVASGYDLQETRQQVAGLGAWGFLPKPYSLRDLVALVRQALDSGEPPAGQPGAPGGA
ncbi:MAG: PAS domain S-box protein [Desulfarculus sp.]|nr:PAS domain S-box protein [Desulfarculus sp.]